MLDGTLESLPAFGEVQDPNNPESPVTQVSSYGFERYAAKPGFKLKNKIADVSRNAKDEDIAFATHQYGIERQRMLDEAIQQFQAQTQSLEDVLRTPPPKPVKAQLSQGQQIAGGIAALIAPNLAGDITTHLMGRAHEEADKATEQQLNEWKFSQANAMRELKTAEDIRNFRLETQMHLLDQEFKLKLDAINQKVQGKSKAKADVAEAWQTGNVAQYNFAMQELAHDLSPEEIEDMDKSFNERVKQIQDQDELDRTLKDRAIRVQEGNLLERQKATTADLFQKSAYKPWNELAPEQRSAYIAEIGDNAEGLWTKAYQEHQGKMDKIAQDIAASKASVETAKKNATTARINATKKGATSESKAAYVTAANQYKERVHESMTNFQSQLTNELYKIGGVRWMFPNGMTDEQIIVLGKSNSNPDIKRLAEQFEYYKKEYDAALASATEAAGGRAGNSNVGGGKADKFGYIIGQTAKRGNDTFEYIGNDQWRKVKS